ncbi:MAG: hypothetical protein GX597_13705 [Anaerolineaceae bacterium]|nr:hypothetical protein [Anaerolineaceae bacterium]
MAASGGHWVKSSSGRGMFRTAGGEIGGAQWIGDALKREGATMTITNIRSALDTETDTSYREKLKQREHELRLKVEEFKQRIESQPLRGLDTFAPGQTVIDQAGRVYRVKSQSGRTALLEPLLSPWRQASRWGKAERVRYSSKQVRPVDRAAIEFMRGKLAEEGADGS